MSDHKDEHKEESGKREGSTSSQEYCADHSDNTGNFNSLAISFFASFFFE